MALACLFEVTANVHARRKSLHQPVERDGRAYVLNHVPLRPDTMLPGKQEKLKHDGSDALAQAAIAFTLAVPSGRYSLQAPPKTLLACLSVKGGDTEKRFAHRIQIPARVGKSHRDQMAAGIAAQNAGDAEIYVTYNVAGQDHQVAGMRSEERRVGKECRSRGTSE